MYDVAIIGAGVTGGLIARTLSAYDLKIVILEKENDVAMGATKANSAIVHAGFDAKEGSNKAKFNVLGSKMMAKVCAQLGVKYKNNGSLVIGYGDEDKQTLHELLKRGQANGVPKLTLLEGEELRRREPNLSSEVTCALYAPTAGIICPYTLTLAAVGNAMDNGAELKTNFEVHKIINHDGYYEIVSGTETVLAKVVINAAGAYADTVAAMAGEPFFTVKPRRGEYILLDKECGNTVSHTIFKTPSKMGKGILVSPTVDGNLLTGPTSVDMEDKENTQTTKDGLKKVLAEAENMVSGINVRQSIRSFCGLRAVGSTGDFIITSKRRGLIHAGGIESPGLSASPAIAAYIVGLLKEQGYELTVNPQFNPNRPAMHRFKEASRTEKNRMIRENPSYGKIVCRCESVTEGEILEAIRMNPKPGDLDGVKRRTRAQMGRCQGGFCTPYIMKLLAKELQLPYEQIAKSGGESWLLSGTTKEGN